jgi:hypothetical protein
MQPSMIKSSIFAASLVAIVLTATGCGGSKSADTSPSTLRDPKDTSAVANVKIAGVDRSNSALSGIRGLRDELAADKVQVERTLGDLAEVMNGQGDLVTALKRFTLSVSDSKSAQQRAVARTDDMRARARDYITGWEVEVYGVDDPELRRQAETRRTQVRNNYGRLTESIKATRIAYEKYEMALDDIQRFLANDLTKAGVEAAAASARKANDAGTEYKRQLDSSIAELDRVAGEMTPAGTTKGGAAAVR